MKSHEHSHGWCSLRIRFDERELELLKGAEQVRGAAFAHTTRPEVLRTALGLAKAGQKLGVAAPRASVSLDESEVGLLLEALRYATDEVRRAAASRPQDNQAAARPEPVMTAFPELVQKGLWRSFGLIRELDALATRLQVALHGAAHH